MPRSPLAHIIDGRKKVNLSALDAADTRGMEKEEAVARLEALGKEFAELGNLLTFAGQNALLIVLQGRDASGKDGAIRKILDFSNIQNARVESFKVPSELERDHDFLWRVHRVAPPRGHITLFNRSHYEDVLAARVHGLVPEATWRARYDHINAFERLLGDNGTIVLKFYLHISREEQLERLLEREKAALTAWKLNPGDWKELPLWDEVTAAYEDAINRCCSRELPWYLIPADKKWFRNLAIIERIVFTLRPYRSVWEKALEEMGKRSLAEIRALRATARRKGLMNK